MIRILLVEDVETDALLAGRALRRAGLEHELVRVETAEEMQSALVTASWDVVLSDYALPRFSGPEALAVLKATGLDLPFIVLSGRVGEDAAVALMRAGANDYVQKTQMALLAPAVRRELRDAEVRRERARTAEELRRSEAELKRQRELLEVLVEERTRELRRSEAVARAVLDTAVGGIITTDEAGLVELFNPSATELFGYAPEEAVGRRVTMLVAEPEGGPLERALASGCEGSVPRAWESTGLTRDGRTVPIELTVGPFSVEGRRSYAFFIRDISARVELEQMKADFVNRAAHELRTPLTTVIMMASLIREGGPAAETERYWRILEAELARQRSLVERLLAVGRMDARTERGRALPCSVTAILKDPLEVARVLSEARSVSLDVRVPGALPDVLGDPALLPHVFTNLLDNALKFTGAGGRVSVAAEAEGPFVKVAIADSGIGIPLEDQPRLFARFFRARNAVEGHVPGSGIGLHLVRTVVEQAGGRVDLESEPGRGTRVTVSLGTPGGPAAR